MVSAARASGSIEEDLLLDDADSVALEQRAAPAALRDRAVTDELPELAQPHRERGLPVDEHDLVLVAEQPLQLHRGGDAAEAASEDERASAHATADTRATTSVSVGASSSTCKRSSRPAWGSPEPVE